MRNLTILFISVIFISKSYGQDSKFNVGFECGSNLTTLIPRGGNTWAVSEMDNSKWILSSQNLNLHSNINFTGNFNIEYSFSSSLSLQSEIGFSKIMASQNEIAYEGTTNIPYKFTFNYDYLNIPLTAKLSTTGKIKFYLFAGPYVGFLLKYYVVRSSISNIEPEQTYNTNKGYNDLGISFGLGSNIPLTNRIEINLQIKTDYGLTNINGAEYFWEKLYTQSLGLLVGLKYKL
jgi:Outer membrane protein beta-barrel domain